MELFSLILLIGFSVIGFAAIFFTTFGTLIILIGSILFALMTEFSVIDIRIMIILLTLYLCGEILEYIFVIAGAKKFGATNAASVGAIVGGIVGAIAGTTFLGIGIIFGTFIGIFLGAFLVELVLRKDTLLALKAGAGGVIGRIGSIIAKVMIATVMLWIIAWRIVASGMFR